MCYCMKVKYNSLLSSNEILVRVWDGTMQYPLPHLHCVVFRLVCRKEEADKGPDLRSPVVPLICRGVKSAIFVSLHPRQYLYNYVNCVIVCGSLVTTAWRVLRLRMEETASRYGG
jgi:hypothetical protein